MLFRSLRLRRYEGRPSVDLLGVEQRAALVASGEGVAEKDGIGEVADVLCLRGLDGSERVRATTGASGEGDGEKA